MYSRFMARITIDIDEYVFATIMRRFQFKSESEAVNYALRTVAAKLQR